MSVQVINSNKRFVISQSKRFCCIQTNKQAANKSWTYCSRECINLLWCNVCLVKCLLNNMLIASRCSLAAISGITPPYFSCVLICDATTFETTSLPFFTIAQAVSSQLDSIAIIRLSAPSPILTSFPVKRLLLIIFVL